MFFIGFVSTIDEGKVTIIPVDWPCVSFVDTSTTSNDNAKILVTSPFIPSISILSSTLNGFFILI